MLRNTGMIFMRGFIDNKGNIIGVMVLDNRIFEFAN